MAGVFLILTALSGFRPAQSADVVQTSGYNIILVVVDCLRADHLSGYGYGRKTSPHMDRFAGEASVFRQAIAPAPNTLLSFSSIFTSRNVSSHGVDSLDKALSGSALTLAEILKIYNYRTAAFVGGALFNPVFGLNQGFDTYYQLNYTTASFRNTFPKALDWAREATSRGEKFFLVVHGNDLHAPYAFPASGLYTGGSGPDGKFKSLSERDWDILPVYKRKLYLPGTRELVGLTDDDVGYLIARYDEGINYADGLFGGFMDGLRDGKILDRSIVILTADHGEGLFDHDYFFHDFNLYENTLHVPLIVKIPGLPADEIKRLVGLIDLMPTVLELAGITVNEDAQGRSLKPLLYGEAGGIPDRNVLSEDYLGGKALRTEKRKLIRYPDRAELYDLNDDPAERTDLARAEPETVKELKEELAGLPGADKDGTSKPLPSGDQYLESLTLSKGTPMQLYKKLPRLLKRGIPPR